MALGQANRESKERYNKRTKRISSQLFNSYPLSFLFCLGAGHSNKKERKGLKEW
jgi:hypothetical protein